MSNGGYTHRVVLTYADLTETAANGTQTIALLSLLAGQAVLRCALRVATALADASDAAFNSVLLEVGDGGDTDRYLTSTQLNVNGTEVLYKLHPSTTPNVYVADDTVDALFTPGTGKILTDIDVGELTLLFEVADLNKVAGPAQAA